MGHLGYQHTFVSLHWLYDLNQFIRSNYSEINWDRVRKLTKSLKHENSTRICIWILKSNLNTPLPSDITQYFKEPSFIFKQIFTGDYFWKSDRKRYLMLKHFCKDSLWIALEYNLKWVRARLHRN